MARQERKHGTTIRTLTDPETGAVLGWVLRWDNGEVSHMAASSLPRGAVEEPDGAGKDEAAAD